MASTPKEKRMSDLSQLCLEKRIGPAEGDDVVVVPIPPPETPRPREHVISAPVETRAARSTTLVDGFGSRSSLGGDAQPFVRCKLGGPHGAEIFVLRGDLKKCMTDAIVSPANRALTHSGGLARAISVAGGELIDRESRLWIEQYGQLEVGSAASTSAGNLPCRFVIHAVGPNLTSSRGSTKPTRRDFMLQRSAVWSALCEAATLEISSVALPGMVGGLFADCRDQAAREIVDECKRFCQEQASTTVRSIVLVNIDKRTFDCFAKAMGEAADRVGVAVKPCDGAPFLELAGHAKSKRSGHSAAGIIHARVRNSKLEVLVGIEYRHCDTNPGRCVNFLGGKVEPGENALATACREFSEEVGGLVAPEALQRYIPHTSHRVYIRSGNYMVFVAPAGDANKQLHALPDLYEEKKRNSSAQPVLYVEMDHLLWLGWNDLLAASQAPVPTLHTRFGSFSVSGFLCRVLPEIHKQLDAIFDDIFIRTCLKSERRSLDRLKTLRPEDLVSKMLGEHWKLQLKAPTQYLTINYHEQIQVREREFLEEMAKRLRNALSVYNKELCGFEAEATATKTEHGWTTPSTADVSLDATRVHNAGPLLRRALTAKAYFSQCLPLYEAKPRVIKVLKSKQVVILMAEIGSGKSTQLPQILLDNVLPASETRRIAVLEPRRVNAIALCQRVSVERGTPPGGEVGYSLGRGESKTTEGKTRIEFMTHGLFVQIAKDPARLLERYCAVIVDEAHERSVDVDLSLAFIKRAMRQLQEKEDFFRVVVTSATIDSEAERFQAYLDPSEDKQQSQILRVEGRSFPVHVEHRDDVYVDAKVLGTAGVGRVLTSYATQTAIDLLGATETGNILIFLPGEGSIRASLEVAKQDVLDRLAEKGSVHELHRDAGDLRGSTSSNMFKFVMAADVSEEEKADYIQIRRRRKGKPQQQQQLCAEKKDVVVCMIGFHGKMAPSDRDLVLHPDPAHRMVVFTTNLAETGVTIPNVRYVIDTGLERRVRWNETLDMNEVVTERASKSSMVQRTGRAGRVASGVCIRLFPASVCDELRELPPPGVQNAMVYKTVLLNKWLQQQLASEPVQLIESIAPATLEKAEQNLFSLGALDSRGVLTKEGQAIMSLGIDLRLGRFLIACSRFGCLVTGLQLMSVLIVDAPERLLPDCKSNEAALSSMQLSLMDPSGDHLTLLNIATTFEAARAKGQELNWCKSAGVDLRVLSDAEAARGYLMRVLADLNFVLADDQTTIEQNGGARASILRALCAAYFDQIATPRLAGQVREGFTRVLDDERNAQALSMQSEFASRTAPGSDPPAGVGGEATNEAIVRLSQRSTLWHDTAGTTTESESTTKLIVFGSIMLTDGSSQVQPSVQLANYVSQADVHVGAQLFNLDSLTS